MSETLPMADLERRAASPATHGHAVRAMFDRIAPTYDVLNRLIAAASTDVGARARFVSWGAHRRGRSSICAPAPWI